MILLLGAVALVCLAAWAICAIQQRSAEADAWRRAEAELRAAKDEAEHASRAKDFFLATMSHEVRTPMNGVLGMIDLVGEGELSAEQREYLDLARISARSLLRVINEILEVSKAEAGKLALEPAPFDLRALVASTVEASAVLGRQKGLDVAWRAGPAVPRRVVGDAGRLRQVLTNLLGNAVKFTEAGGVSLEVQPAGGDLVRFAVRDTGPGIAAAHQPLLFRSFSQVDGSLARRHGGTGLGLAISRLIVERMGGTIGVESREGEGSTFFCDVPLPPAPTGEGGREPPAEPDPPRRALRILVAEDDVVSRRFVEELLGREGFAVEGVADGRAAVEALERGAHDLVVMDVQLPELDGLEVTRRLRRGEAGAGRRVPVVGVTAFASPADRDRCLEAGMDSFVPKPVDRGELLAAIRGLT